MDLHYKQEITVGGLVLLGIALFVAGIMWLGGKSFSGDPTVSIMFEDVQTLKAGSPVKVSGVTMGTVKRIEFEDYGRVRVEITLDERIRPKRDARARIASIGLVGDVVIQLDPGKEAEELAEGTVIIGEVDKGLSEIGANLSAKADSVLTGLSQIEYRRLSDGLNATLADFQRLTRVYSNTRTGPVAELTRTMESFRTLSERFDSTLGATNLARTTESADSLMQNLSRLSSQAKGTAAQLDTLLARVNRGEGSLGRLASDTLFYDNTQRLVRSLQEFVDDLRRNPGKIGLTVRIF